ncbi:hypothetical protein [Cytobacillus sp. IB215665]|nr:hypothetical protein [Cytobacillus sp. IB215665]MDX8364364.1 hypothetical protein [Cytobacillus sp. IB215665]
MPKQQKTRGQKGKQNSDTTNTMMSVEELEKATHPTNRQNSKS